MSIQKLSLVLALFGAVLFSRASAFGAGDPLDALAPKSLVSQGNLTRLDHVFAKAIAGHHITVGVIGGSITQGAMATQPRYRYGNLVAHWFAKTFPKARVSLVNAGIGATGTHYGCLRVRRDLLSYHPNFVIVEFAVNDGPQKSYSETYEGLIRQILSAPNHPAVMELFLMFYHNGASQEVPEEKIGYHYDLPMISYRNALWPLLRTKKLPWSAIQSLSFPGDFHPNNRGHALIAYFVTSFLHHCLVKLEKSTGGISGPHHFNLPPIPALPKPLYTNIYAHTRLWGAGQIKPVSDHGWKLAPLAPSIQSALAGLRPASAPGGKRSSHPSRWQSWSSGKPGSAMTFHVRGRSIFLIFYRHDGPYGKAQVQVDHHPPRILNAWFPGTWGGYPKTDIIAEHLSPGVHTVRLMLLKSHSSGSTGHQFQILAIGAAGVKN